MYYVISILTTVLEQEEEALKKAKSDLFKNVIKDNILQIKKSIEILKNKEL